MNLIGLSVGLVLVGLSLGLAVGRRLPLTLLAVSAYLLGAAAWAAVTVVILVLGIPYTLVSAGTGTAAVGLAALIWARRRGGLRLSRAQGLALAGSVLIYTLLAALGTRFNLSQATGDSVIKILTGRALVLDGLSAPVQANLQGNSLLPVSLQAAAFLVGAEYNYLHQPLTALSLCALFLILSVRSLRALGAAPGTARAAAGLALGGFTASYLFLFHSGHIHDNLTAAAFLFTGMVSLWWAQREPQAGWLGLAAAAFTGLSLTRIDGALYGLLSLAVFLSLGTVTPGRLLRECAPFLALAGLWMGRILFFGSSSTNYLNSGNAAFILGALASFALLLAAAQRWPALARVWLPRLHWVELAAVGLAFAVFTLTAPQTMLQSLRVTADNLLFEGWWWGPLWLAVLGLGLLALTQPALPAERIFSLGIGVFFLFLMTESGLRDPYRYGIGDSANRAMLHILPVVMFYLLLKLTPGRAPLPAAEARLRSSGRYAAALLAAGGLFAGVSLLWAFQPQDYARSAQVTEGSGAFAEETGVEWALRGFADERYALAGNSGPLTLTLDLGHVRPASVLEVKSGYQGAGRGIVAVFSDYRWETSADGWAWQVVYDSRAEGAGRVRAVSETVYQYPLAQQGEFRYVRLRYRGENDQRLMLWRLSVYSHSPDGFFRP